MCPDPLVSIITPSYNSAQFITATIKSVQDQTFEAWEHIIVDDASTDATLDILKVYCASEPRAHLIEFKQNQGAAAARNVAIERARGRYIAFLDSDDLWHPAKLRKQLAFMTENAIAFSYSSYDKIDAQGTVIGASIVPKKVRYHDLLKNNAIGCLTAMFDTHALGKVKMPDIRRRQDLGLWLRLLQQTDHAYGLQETLAQYRLRSDSVSSNKFVAARFTWQLYRDTAQLPLPQACYYFTHYLVNGILKTYLK